MVGSLHPLPDGQQLSERGRRTLLGPKVVEIVEKLRRIITRPGDSVLPQGAQISADSQPAGPG
ncbi:hypothetical protein [Streptomyces sp. NPDC058466]|uniref:hypothetical protein n=1 Tax=Streptomyces sp. NPDC058466 TaxID=3346512 RepID=UPI003646D99F